MRIKFFSLLLTFIIPTVCFPVFYWSSPYVISGFANPSDMGIASNNNLIKIAQLPVDSPKIIIKTFQNGKLQQTNSTPFSSKGPIALDFYKNEFNFLFTDLKTKQVFISQVINETISKNNVPLNIFGPSQLCLTNDGESQFLFTDENESINLRKREKNSDFKIIYQLKNNKVKSNYCSITKLDKFIFFIYPRDKKVDLFKISDTGKLVTRRSLNLNSKLRPSIFKYEDSIGFSNLNSSGYTVINLFTKDYSWLSCFKYTQFTPITKMYFASNDKKLSLIYLNEDFHTAYAFLQTIPEKGKLEKLFKYEIKDYSNCSNDEILKIF